MSTMPVGGLRYATRRLARQYSLLSHRFDERAQMRRDVLERASTVISLEHDFRKRLFDGRRLSREDALTGWQLEQRRLAEVQLFLLHPGNTVLEALQRLTEVAKEYGPDPSALSDDEFRIRSAAHAAALLKFEVEVGQLIAGARNPAMTSTHLRSVRPAQDA